MSIETEERAPGIWTLAVTHECGHRYQSQSTYATDEQARRSGTIMLGLACSTCRDHRT